MVLWGRNLVVAVALAGGIIAGCGSFSASGEGTMSPEGGADRDSAADAPDGEGMPDASNDGATSSDAMDAGDALDAKTNCAGDAGCAGSACSARCPAIGNFVGDRLRFEAVGSSIHVRSLTDCNLYECLVIVGTTQACANVALGHVGRACSSSNPGSCGLGEPFNIGVADDDNCGQSSCTYSCQQIAQ